MRTNSDHDPLSPTDIPKDMVHTIAVDMRWWLDTVLQLTDIDIGQDVVASILVGFSSASLLPDHSILGILSSHVRLVGRALYDLKKLDKCSEWCKLVCDQLNLFILNYLPASADHGDSSQEQPVGRYALSFFRYYQARISEDEASEAPNERAKMWLDFWHDTDVFWRMDDDYRDRLPADRDLNYQVYDVNHSISAITLRLLSGKTY
jgi:hypothetical protein